MPMTKDMVEIRSQDMSLSLLVGYFEYFIIFFRLVQYLKKERLENIYISFEVTQAQLIELFWLHQNHNKIQKHPPVNLNLRPDFGSLETISLVIRITFL